ncbi:cytidine deaminase [Halovenus salina]|uniref:Cytidine deaminase n=1 Tax=Halovenus salina TaxID=1510225 RepID=A0ABD5W024_9EURY|nr:cytidine deaminase [Halovenus salina]
MDTKPLSDSDRELIDRVIKTNERSFDDSFFEGAHIVAAGVRTTDRTVYDGVSLPAAIGRASLCAEPVAIGSAVADGHNHDDIETCVAISYPMDGHDAEDHRVVPPCGVCREMLVDYNDEMRVIVTEDGEPRVTRAVELLPGRTW